MEPPRQKEELARTNGKEILLGVGARENLLLRSATRSGRRGRVGETEKAAMWKEEEGKYRSRDDKRKERARANHRTNTSPRYRDALIRERATECVARFG